MMFTLKELVENRAKYGVVLTRHINHEGDERSRTHPGHGYPAYTESVTEFRSFKSKEDFEEWAMHPARRGDAFTPVIYFEMKKKETVEFHL